MSGVCVKWVLHVLSANSLNWTPEMACHGFSWTRPSLLTKCGSITMIWKAVSQASANWLTTCKESESGKVSGEPHVCCPYWLSLGTSLPCSHTEPDGECCILYKVMLTSSDRFLWILSYMTGLKCRWFANVYDRWVVMGSTLNITACILENSDTLTLMSQHSCECAPDIR